MLTDPADPTRVLYEPADLAGTLDADTAPLRAVLDWAGDYLARPHPELGRRGNVCPYAQGALDRGTFLLAVQRGRPADADKVAETLLAHRDWFEEQCRAAPDGASYRTVLVVFPDLERADVARVIDGTQQRLKPEYVSRGLMIGEFHDGPPDKGGLWNEDFRPLRSPLPLLAIRQLVPTDFPFLRDDPELVAAYLARHGGRVPAHLRTSVREAADRFGLDTRASTEPAGEAVPLTARQQRLWFLNQLDPGNPVQHLATGLRLAGPVDTDRLAAALDAVVAGHAVLRTVLAERDGEPVAVVAAKAPAALGVADVAAADAPLRARAEARRPFDLRRGPLLRGLLLRCGPEDALLVLTAHALAADETSLDLLAAEIGTRYAGRPGSQDPAPPAPADDDGLAYWVERLAGAPALLELPTDRPRPPAQSYRGERVAATVPADVVAALTDRGWAVEPAVLAALDVVLARHAGGSDVLVGTPFDVRPAGRADAVGPYTNTVVLRADLAAGPESAGPESAGPESAGPESAGPGLAVGAGFAGLVRRVRADLAAARAHGRVPFERVVAELDVGRGLDRSPLHQVSLAVAAERPVPSFGDLAAGRVAVPTGAVGVDLAVTARPAGGGLELELAYAADLFDADTVERLAGHLVTVLRHAAAEPDRPVHTLPLLDPAERDRVLRDAHGAQLPVPEATWPLIERWVRETPDAVAVSGVDGELTYRQLHDRAAQLAHVLRAWGVGPEVPVGLCVDRSAAMVVALLGVWLAGGAYLPLDPGFPPDRLRATLADAGAELAVTAGGARERLAGLLAELPGVVDLDGDADVLAAQPTEPPGVATAGDALAYLVYTSGSTGRPKGVQVPHRAVANLVAGFDALLGLRPGDRWLAVTTISFDIAALELLLPLASGAQVVVATEAATADGEALRTLAAGATVLQATPTTWRLLLAAGGVPAGLRLRLCGGEAVPRDLADAIGADGTGVWNVYGPTETTVWSAAGPVASAPAPVLLGPPIANTTITVLDPYGEPVPVGVVGELHIGGLGVARGYRGLPELTAERFRPDGRPGAFRYATGDLARRRPDGRIEFLGRADGQVKVRGFRIELGEVEAVLRADPGVRDAVVTTWSGADGDTRLVAYVVPESTVDGLPERLRARAREVLPEYMVPAGVELLDALPLTPNNKVDRRALPEPRWGAGARARREPATAVERALVGLWSDVLGIADLGVDDDFFDRGGHSLLGARLLARVRAYFSTDIPTRSLFDAPTVAGMAAVLVRLEDEPGRAEAIAETRLAVEAMSPEEVRALLGEGP